MDTDENIASYQYYLLFLIDLLYLLSSLMHWMIEMLVLVKLILLLYSNHYLSLQDSPVFHSSVVLKIFKKMKYYLRNNHNHSLLPVELLFDDSFDVVRLAVA